MNWEQLRRMMNETADWDDLIGQQFIFYVEDGPQYSGRADDWERHKQDQREQFARHYGAGPRFFEEARSQYRASEEEYQRQRRENEPGASGDLPHGYHDDVRNLTYLNWHGWRGWVTDEDLARHDCWMCLIGPAHLKEMCEKWKFPDPVHYYMGFNSKHDYKMAYSYDLTIPEDVLDLGSEDGAFVITSLDKVIGTDIALI